MGFHGGISIPHTADFFENSQWIVAGGWYFGASQSLHHMNILLSSRAIFTALR